MVFTIAVWAMVTLAVYLFYRLNKREPPLERIPGPRAFPILGNIADFPPAGVPEYQHWLKHKDLYGGISSVTVMDMTLVMIHDKQIAHDLLDRASSKTSGRPTMIMANKLCGYESIVLCQGYNTTFRHCRALLHRELGTKVSAAQIHDAQEIEVNRQLVRMLNEPEGCLAHFRTTAAATVLKLAYGYAIDTQKPDVLVATIDQMMKEFSLAAVPMAWAVDIIPSLQHLPENLPGATFKKTARSWRRSIQASAYIPYRFVRRKMAASEHRPSYVSKLVEHLRQEGDGNLSDEDEQAIIWSAASLYGAAADTTAITLTAFTLAMILFPEVQKQAQEEIDHVVGTDRLPTFADRENLPYINALIKESTRWWPIAPMGFPHTATEDIQYNDLHIPKGAYLMPAVWWFLHDPETYHNPKVFEPLRFLHPRNEPDPSSEAFGYGRRICPGRFFADASLYLNIVQTLAVFDIGKAVDETGKDIEVDVRPKPGILTYPTEFKHKIRPRSEKHADLIRSVGQRCAWEDGDAELLDSVSDFKMM